MVFDWLRGKKKTRREELDEEEHPFDRAARETNDAVAKYKETTESIEEAEERKALRDALKRVKQ